MAEAKTKPTNQTVESFIKKIPDPQTREDCFTIVTLMKDATRSDPQMWGASIVGFGITKVQYAGGREGDWPLMAFSPRKQNLTLYGMTGHPELREKLGKHSVSKGCLYIKRLSDINLPTLKKLIRETVKQKNQRSA